MPLSSQKNLKLSQSELFVLYALMKLYLEDIVVAQGYHGEDYGDEACDPVSKKELKTLLKKIMPLLDKTALRKAENAFLEAKYGDWNRAPDEGIMNKVNDAINTKRTACMKYFSPDSGLSKRNIDIYAKNARYTVGFCHLRNEIRKFRNSRIVSIRLLGEKFEVPKDFDKREHL